ncbi:MAG: hypothetical protein ACLFNQ_09925 [Spirochaetaceae bacterium]
MKLTELLEEQGLELDDVRWYCAEQNAERLLTLGETKNDLVHAIWSGRVEKDLRDLGERFTEQVDQDYQKNLIDESDLHRYVQEIMNSRKRRNRQ